MIFQKSFSPPLRFTNDFLCCFPTDENYFESDHEAVMASRETLRLWSHSTWPEDSFSREQNKDDLLLHVEDNIAHTAYGYMLYNPDRTRCLGSVYVNPADSLAKYYTIIEGSDALLQNLDARIEYWIRDCPLDQFLKISGCILDWIHKDWNIRSCYTAREEMTKRMQVYRRLNLRKILSLKNKGDGSRLFVFR